MLADTFHQVLELELFKIAVFIAIVIGIIVLIVITKEDGLFSGLLYGIGSFIIISLIAFGALFVFLVGGALLLLVIGIVLGIILL